MIAAAPNSNLITGGADFELDPQREVCGENQVSNIFIQGTTPDYTLISTVDFSEGRFFNEMESRGARQRLSARVRCGRCAFPGGDPIDKFVQISGQRFKVIGVGARQGTFLGLFSLGLDCDRAAAGVSKSISARRANRTSG